MSNDFIPTRASIKRNIQEASLNTVTYQSYKRKGERNELDTDVEGNKKVAIAPANEINMKRARFEIIKFGMSGFKPQKQEEAMVQLAIKLGAKPRKNKYKNYKEILKIKKKEKIREQKMQISQKLGKPQLGKRMINRKDKEKRKKKEKSILGIYGTVKQTAINVSKV